MKITINPDTLEEMRRDLVTAEIARSLTATLKIAVDPKSLQMLYFTGFVAVYEYYEMSITKVFTSRSWAPSEIAGPLALVQHTQGKKKTAYLVILNQEQINADLIIPLESVWDQTIASKDSKKTFLLINVLRKQADNQDRPGVATYAIWLSEQSQTSVLQKQIAKLLPSVAAPSASQVKNATLSKLLDVLKSGNGNASNASGVNQPQSPKSLQLQQPHSHHLAQSPMTPNSPAASSPALTTIIPFPSMVAAMPTASTASASMSAINSGSSGSSNNSVIAPTAPFTIAVPSSMISSLSTNNNSNSYSNSNGYMTPTSPTIRYNNSANTNNTPMFSESALEALSVHLRECYSQCEPRVMTINYSDIITHNNSISSSNSLSNSHIHSVRPPWSAASLSNTSHSTSHSISHTGTSHTSSHNIGHNSIHNSSHHVIGSGFNPSTHSLHGLHTSHGLGGHHTSSSTSTIAANSPTVSHSHDSTHSLASLPPSPKKNQYSPTRLRNGPGGSMAILGSPGNTSGNTGNVGVSDNDNKYNAIANNDTNSSDKVDTFNSSSNKIVYHNIHGFGSMMSNSNETQRNKFHDLDVSKFGPIMIFGMP